MSVNFYKKKVFLFVFLIPNIITMIYFSVIATKQYVSEAPLIVYQGGKGEGQSVNLTGSGMSLEGVYLVQAHIRSWDCFSKLDPNKLSANWSEGDFVSRYGGLLNLFQRSPTKLWKYYQGHVEPVIDEETGILKLQVTGYDRAFVRDVAQAVIKSSGEAVNRIKQESFENSSGYMQRELSRQSMELDRAIAHFSALKRANGVVDAGAAYSSRLEQLNDANAKIASLSSQISIVQSSTPNSDQLKNLLSERRGLEARAAGVKQEVEQLVKIVGDIDAAQNAIRTGQEKLAAVQAQHFAAQQEALNSRYFVAAISPPNEPVDSTEPARLFWILCVMASTFVIYLIVK